MVAVRGCITCLFNDAATLPMLLFGNALGSATVVLLALLCPVSAADALDTWPHWH